MTDPSVLVPNLAAEEGAVWHDEDGESAARTLARLWRCLFPPEARLLESAQPFERAWPQALGPAPPGAAALRQLEAPGRAFAWLNTADALDLAAAQGQALVGATPEVVARVHDKAFALGVAEREGLMPPSLRDLVESFDADALRDRPAAVMERIAARVARHPDWTCGRFTLKPRWGSSGRGRVAGRRGEDCEALRRALPRLAERGGALLEPWLERRADASVQLWVGEEGVTLLGSLELLVSPAGVYRGHRGWIDYKARISSGLAEDEALREAAVVVAAAARDAGYAGPCGVDAFRFAGPDGDEVRPVVELNARFTAGTVAVGLLRRLWPRLRERHGLEPGERRAFLFGLAPPAGGWPDAEGVDRVDLGDTPARDEGPALLVARDAPSLG